MKILTDSLKTHWKRAAGVCPPQTTVPAYQYVRLDIGQGCFALSSTDGEIFVHTGDCGDPEFSRLLPAKRFSRLLEVANSEQIGFAENVVKCGDDVWELSAPDVASWEYAGVKDLGRQYWVDTKELKAALQIGVLAVDTDSSRHALGGILFEFMDSNTLAIVATDGRRLALSKLDCECSGDADDEVRPVVPLKAIKILMAALPNEGKVCFQFGLTNGIVFDTGDSVLHSPLVNGSFPKWQSVVPDGSGDCFDLLSGELAAALKAAAIVSNDESRGVECTLNEDGITAIGVGADVGRSRVKRGGLFGSTANFKINPDYVLPLLGKVGSDCELQLAYTNEESPLLLTHDGGLSYVLMPMAKD